MNLFFPRRPPDETILRIDGREVVVRVRVSPRARAYRLAIPHAGGPVLTLPPHGRWREAEAFLRRQTGWLAARLSRVPLAIPFAAGARVPLRGVPHLVVGTGLLRGRVEITASEEDGPILSVPGAPEHLPRRLADWLKAEARSDLVARSDFHAVRLGVEIRSVAMRSQATRWGSCSSAGRLNYNWRLILAPDFVLDYVAAHEVAHLLEMNHSAAFWATVERTLPDMARGRAWLKAHGRELMAYGAD
ncbi:M48 family peptidase [Arsenicitalea aurantiaca]|uniref:M48 family peptidase n=1 Tax=Arsenicitalea aurantiaca TaxID=1783274 RepID=A0A433X845_9HYPH|nr:SprT family zinc-dependent metalloprotease [Arsenicitalea aurantiaca]RUT30223.1 M48 family peptidase [Arsenicitalea aurantiaca]